MLGNARTSARETHTTAVVKPWSDHRVTSPELIEVTCVPLPPTCSHSGDFDTRWDSAGVLGQRDFLVSKASNYSRVSLSESYCFPFKLNVLPLFFKLTVSKQLGGLLFFFFKLKKHL